MRKSSTKASTETETNESSSTADDEARSKKASERAAEVSEEAQCCLTGIEELLDEIQAEDAAHLDKTKLPWWHPDAEFDADNSPKPSLPEYDDVAQFMFGKDYSELSSEEIDKFWDSDIASDMEDTYHLRQWQWHAARGLSYVRGCICW